MNTTCHDCQQPVRRADAHIRSVVFEQVLICRPCMSVRAVGAAVEAVFADPQVVVAGHMVGAA